MNNRKPLLRINDLSVAYTIDNRRLLAVKNAFIDLHSGEGVGVVGESGSGKSTFARAMMALLPSTNAEVVGGTMEIDGQTIPMTDKDQIARLRGRTFAMVFQDPLSYLNPLLSIRSQIVEAVRLNDPGADNDKRVRQLLDLVRLPQRCLTAYPHELSGGMRQRVLIAIALGCRPKVLIADEPTTALDVTTQAEILALIRDIKRELNMALVLISHDLGVVSNLCDRVFVMYGGYTVETGGRSAILSEPAHPYTRALIHAARSVRTADGKFVTLNDDIPRVTNHATSGCPFITRCSLAEGQCGEAVPPIAMYNNQAAHLARCYLPS